MLISDEGQALITDFGLSHITMASGAQNYTSSLLLRSSPVCLLGFLVEVFPVLNAVKRDDKNPESLLCVVM